MKIEIKETKNYYQCSLCDSKEDVKMISLDSEESYGRQSIHLCKDCRLLLSNKLREGVK